MSEEVKEILDRLNNIPMGELYACCLEDSECKIILEYITNLQKENERLKEQKKEAIEFINIYTRGRAITEFTYGLFEAKRILGGEQ